MQTEDYEDMEKWIRYIDKYVDKINMIYCRQINKLENDRVPYEIPKF